METKDDLDWLEDFTINTQLDYLVAVTKTPATVAEFNSFVRARGYQQPKLWSKRGWEWLEAAKIQYPRYWDTPAYQQPDFPVTGISYFEAEAFGNFHNASLLNEFEWHMLATNAKTTRFPWGNEDDAVDGKRANLGFFGEFTESKLRSIYSFPNGRSRSGLWDLIGNVSEWCLPSNTLALSPFATTAVLKGGCSWHAPSVVDAKFRDEVLLNTRDNQTGIRLVRRDFQKRALQTDVAVDSGTTKPNLPAKPRRPVARPTRPFRQEGIPNIENDKWKLNMTGLVNRPCQLTFDDLIQFPKTTRRGLFVCVCRWGEFNEISGVLLSDVMDFVGVNGNINDLFLLQRSVPGPTGISYESTLPLADALKRGAMLCYELDGRPLTPALGAPLRLIDFGVLAYKQVKCLGELCLTTEFATGWWERECQYDPSGQIQPGTILVVGNNPHRLEIGKFDGVSCVKS